MDLITRETRSLQGHSKFNYLADFLDKESREGLIEGKTGVPEEINLEDVEFILNQLTEEGLITIDEFSNVKAILKE